MTVSDVGVEGEVHFGGGEAWKAQMQRQAQVVRQIQGIVVWILSQKWYFSAFKYAS